jgi:hypothetical protein
LLHLGFIGLLAQSRSKRHSTQVWERQIGFFFGQCELNMQSTQTESEHCRFLHYFEVRHWTQVLAVLSPTAIIKWLGYKWFYQGWRCKKHHQSIQPRMILVFGCNMVLIGFCIENFQGIRRKFGIQECKPSWKGMEEVMYMGHRFVNHLNILLEREEYSRVKAYYEHSRSLRDIRCRCWRSIHRQNYLNSLRIQGITYTRN